MTLALEVALAYLVLAVAYVSGQLAGTATPHNLSPILLAGIVVLPPLFALLLGAAAPGLLKILDNAADAAERYRNTVRRKQLAAARARRQERNVEVNERFRGYAEKFGVKYPGGLE